MKKKLPLIIGAIVVVVILIIAGGLIYTKVIKKPAKPVAQTEQKKKKRTDPLNVIAVFERPFIEIRPGGKNVILSVNELKKPATSVDYELEYQAGELLQGAFGTLELASLPATKDILLGSCSAGGACTYHTDVKGGSLLTRYTGEQNYALKSDWKYIENKTKAKSFQSTDTKFEIESKELSAQSTLIIFNTPGYPKTPTGTVISDIYSVTTVSPVKGTAKVTIQAAEDAPTSKIMGWDGQAWQALTSKVNGQSVTADGNLFSVYVVVK